MLRIGKGIVVELEGRGHHGAKLQKLPPAGRKRKVGCVVFHESSFVRSSYAEEDFAPVHPQEEEPVDEQHGGAKQQGLQSRAEHKERLWPQVGEEAALNKFLPHVGNEVSGNRVCAEYDEGKCPTALLLDVDDPAEQGQDQEADAAAEEGPAWRPDALDDGANSGEVKKYSDREQTEAGDDELADWLL